MHQNGASDSGSGTAAGVWLYSSHFGLREAPFTLTPDTRFFFAHSACRQALNTLLVAIRSGEGFTKVVGEVGTGKTLLCRRLLDALGEGYRVAYIPNPSLEPMTLLLAVADELGVPRAENPGQHALLTALTQFLAETCARGGGKPAVLCLDEAQAMPVETLETLRLLSNLETRRRKLIQLVLFGQPELDTRLRQHAVRQLRQRISFSYRLVPLDRRGVADYVAHRLQVAGYRGRPLFSPWALRLLYRASRGTPRLVNILAHKALMAAYGEGAAGVRCKHLRRAVADTESLDGSGRLPRLQRYAATALGMMLVSAGAFLWSSWP